MINTDNLANKDKSDYTTRPMLNKKELTLNLKKPKKGCFKQTDDPIIGLAPMEGYSDSAFRQVCKKVNPNILTYTEFTSADGIHYNSKKLKLKLAFEPSEQPVLAQIFGKNTETFISATKFCEDMGFAGIDLNMGCPSKKVVKSEHGVALRKNPDLAAKLVESVAKNTSLPVSVKTRLGWSNGDDLVEFGKRIEEAGADMICIHARTYQEPYNVPPQWEEVYKLKEALSIPVLGNGGINSIQEGLTQCAPLDGFLIGQATFGNPWVFDATEPKLSLEEKLPIILYHAEKMIALKGPIVGTREIRKHLLQYVKGVHKAKEWRSKLVHVTCLDDIKSALNSLVIEQKRKELILT